MRSNLLTLTFYFNKSFIIAIKLKKITIAKNVLTQFLLLI